MNPAQTGVQRGNPCSAPGTLLPRSEPTSPHNGGIPALGQPDLGDWPPLGGLWQVLRSLVVAVAPVSGMDFRVFRVFRVTYARARDADPAPTCRKPAARRA